MLENYKPVLSPEDLQEILPLGRNTIYKLLNSGTIKSKKCGKKYLILKCDLLSFLGASMQGEINDEQ